MPSIRFVEETSYKLRHKRKLQQWILKTVAGHKRKLGHDGIMFIFIDDHQMAGMNLGHLGHSGPTDVITFQYNVANEPIEAEIYISTDTVAANARRFKVSFEEELHRVMIHGVLHLLGYSDKTAAKQKVMRKEEGRWLTEMSSLLRRAR